MHQLFSVFFVLAIAQVGSDADGGQAALSAQRTFASLPASVAVPDSAATVRAGLPTRKSANPWADWTLSLEGATHAPMDMGVQAVLETPVRVRLGFGYGWVPSAYSGLLTGIAASASGDPQVGAILNRASYQGRTYRGVIGIHPIHSLGLYADLGYARVDLVGTLDLATSGVPALAGLGGGYQAHTTMDMWLVEVGSQHKFLDSIVAGVALGLMRTIDSRTDILSVNGAPQSPALGLAAQATDSALKTYGYIPTLTFRLGFDLFAIRSWLAPSEVL